MIALLVAFAIVFAWACIATSVAVSKDQLTSGNRGIIARQELRITELEDRLQASSLSEHYAARHIAMPVADESPEPVYLYDDTGLVRIQRQPAEPAESGTE